MALRQMAGLKGLCSSLAVAALTVSLYFGMTYESKIVRQNSLNIYLGQEVPQSCDPFKFDLFVHHIAFTSVFSNLVTKYAPDGIRPELAESWKAEDDFKRWHFQIKPGVQFENGDPIDAESARKSLTRVAYLQRLRGSRNSFLEYLKGFHRLQSASQLIDGIFVSGQVLTLNFEEPIPRLLEKIALGLYAITHPNDFDPTTGEWRNDKSCISSNSYAIESWKANELVLSLRDTNLLQVPQERAIEKVELHYGKPFKENTFDVIYGNSEAEYESSGYKFTGKSYSNVVYHNAYLFLGEKSEEVDEVCRLYIRSRFYEYMRKSRYKVTHSFFPLSITGISEPSTRDVPRPEACSNVKISFRALGLTEDFYNDHHYAKALRDFYSWLETDLGWNFSRLSESDIDYSKNLGPKDYMQYVDFHPHGTGILLEDPYDDIKFMFLSKEGIQLPDSTGEIRGYLNSTSNENFDLQHINQLIWDQNVIWPVAHTSYAFWIKPSVLDLNSINLIMPATDFNFISWHQE